MPEALLLRGNADRSRTVFAITDLDWLLPESVKLTLYHVLSHLSVEIKRIITNCPMCVELKV